MSAMRIGIGRTRTESNLESILGMSGVLGLLFLIVERIPTIYPGSRRLSYLKSDWRLEQGRRPHGFSQEFQRNSA